MRQKISALVSDANKVVDLIRNFEWLGRKVSGAFSPKVHAERIPPCRGYFQRKEDREIRSKIKSLYKNGNVSSVKVLVLHGPSGHGKDYSAANLMNQLYTSTFSLPFFGILRNVRNRPTILWTIHANNQTRMFESYRSLAKKIGLTEEANVANQELSLLSRTSEGRQHHINLQSQCRKNAYDEALSQIYENVMKELRRHRSWVLLIEDPSEDMSSRLWPQPGDRSFGNGLVIVTTQNPKLLAKEGGDYTLEKVEIGKMTDEDAVNFLSKKSGIPATGANKKPAEDMAIRRLKCVPQDIAEFATYVRAYMEETKMPLTFKDFLRTETATGSECMMILEMTRKNQEELLKFLACCSSGNYLPLEILESYFTEAAEAAKDSKFVNISERDEINVVTMHPRRHDTLRNLLIRQDVSAADETWKDVFKQLFLGNRPININIPKLSGLDVSQVIKCLSSVCKDAVQRCRDEDFTMLRFISPHLKEAVEFSKLTEGEIEPRVLADGHACLGVSLLYSGESEEATAHLKTALALYKGYKGPGNVQLDLANALHFLGEAYSNSHLGDPSKGEMYLREALNEKVEFYNGKAHAQVAFTLRSLGNVLNEMGKQSEAIVHIERALKIYDESENYNRQEYGYTLSALGSAYRYLGQYVQAEDNLKKALKIFRSVDSPSKLRIGVTLSRLSSVQRNMDKLDESIDSLNEALQMFDNNDIYRAVILSKLSVVYRYKGDSKTSFHFAEKVKVISDKQHGTKDHPAIATALLNLGHAESDLGDVEDAVRNLTKAMNIYEALHGKNHRSVAATLNYLGYAYQQMGMVQEGKKKLERAVEIMNQNYSPSHPEKANSLKRLSKACLILGETVKSAELASHAINIYKETYENTMEHREVRKCQVRVAYACSKIGLFDKAKEYLMEVELGFPKEKMAHPEFAALLRKKTEITLDSFEFNRPSDEKKVREILSKANTDLIRAEEIVSNSLGCKHQQFAVTKKEKARLNILMDKYKDAYDDICLALNVIPKVCPHFKAEFSLIRSDVEKELGLNDAQKESLETAEKIYRKAFGENHPMVAFALQKLCTLNLGLENVQNASRYFEASEQACETLKKNLSEQLDSCDADFLKKYKIDAHPIVKRQQLLDKRIRRKQGVL